MTEQLQLRRGAASQLAAFTGAPGEIVIDVTNNRAVVNDGETAGGWPAAKLAEVVTNTRAAITDAAYAALATDRLIAFTALTAARVVTLCAASSYPTGARLMIVDESGAGSAVRTITVAAAGGDLIDGVASFVVAAAYGGVELESNGADAWTVLAPRPNLQASLVGVGTAPDAANPLSVTGAAALFNGLANFNLTVNKGGAAGAAADTASLIFEDGFSGRAQMGLNGSDNFSFKVSANGSAWTTAIALDATTGVPTFAGQRTPVADAAYAALVTDRLVALTALTAARVVSLPAASAYPAGQALTIADESGACSAVKTITVARAGSDTINGAASFALAGAYNYVAVESNGANAWTVVDSTPSANSAVGFRNRIVNGAFAVDQRNAGAAQTFTAGAALAYSVDRFYGYCAGANVSGQRVAGSAPDQYLYKFTGAASVTAIGFGQRIETANSFDLAGQTATLSVKLANSLLTTVTWTASYATTTDAFGTLAAPTKTQIATGTFTVNATLTSYGAQIAIPAAATTGVEIVLSVGAQTSGNWQIGEVQLEPGAVATAFERRPISLEAALCAYYYTQFVYGSSGAIQFSGYAAASAYSISWFSFPPMRAAPTAALVGTWTGSNVSAYSVSAFGNNNSVYIALQATATGYVIGYSPANGGLTLTSEL